jgi:hypothetical protein
MKKLLILFLISCNLCKANHNYILKDTTVIHQISFSRGGNPGYDYSREDLDKQIFNIIFEEDGKVILHVQGKNFKISDHITVSYNGKINKRKFYILTKKLKQIKYTQLKELYVPLVEWEHITSDNYTITYNNGLQKKVTDQIYDVDGLKEFREMLIKLKKEIKWVPVEGSYGVPRS